MIRYINPDKILHIETGELSKKLARRTFYLEGGVVVHTSHDDKIVGSQEDFTSLLRSEYLPKIYFKSDTPEI